MTEIDFITGFGCLLRDGTLRDVFARSPQAAAEKVHLRHSDWPAWEKLIPADVEFQASVLLRKRLDLVKFFAPETCRRSGDKLWHLFQGYARTCWPAEGSAKTSDTFKFCRHLRQQNPRAVAAFEWNRLDFALSKKRVNLHWVQIPFRGKIRRGLQILLRTRGSRWQELFLYLGL